MVSNPFTSETFTRVWSKHFNDSEKGLSFRFIEGVTFIKHSKLPYYRNVGEKLTNGIAFKTSSVNANDFKGKVFLVRDIPSYLNVDDDIEKLPGLQLKKIFQYEGYITRVSDFDSLDVYLKTIYKSNTRSKLRRNVNRLEACFDVEYIMYYGCISKTDFDVVFDKFYKLFEKRYTDKNEPCGELEPKLWGFYSELVYEMINKKQASLFVIYCDKQPVGITFSYHSPDKLVEALTVFDIDYYRYNIGHTTILKMLEWSFNNNVEIFDYTQGDFDYKKRWSNDTYKTHYYLFYDSKSIISQIVALGVVSYFNLKRYLRDKNFNSTYHKLKHRLFKSSVIKESFVEPFIVEIIVEGDVEISHLKEIDIYSSGFMSPRRALFDFLYMNPQSVKNLKIFKSNKDVDTYFVFGDANVLKISKDVA
ncbi:hypothetical protein GCM10022271_21070 [Corallibacter vietnamensis]|uniref:BioF2-like acetyltransferase domain-containing protein n=1 Tax=Corallibacter vietnamensis TaxID=904130 RepID=A0ABP7HE09_9FLAO